MNEKDFREPEVKTPEEKIQLRDRLRRMRTAISETHGKIKLPQRSTKLPFRLQ